MNTGYISELEGLKTWFLRIGVPQWNLYSGFVHKSTQTYIYRQDDPEIELERSWDLLQEMLELNSAQGGKFTVYVPAYPGNKPAKVFFWPKPAFAGQLAPGIGGYPASAGASVGYSEQQLAERINEAIEKERLKRRIEDLEAAQAAKADWQDVLMEKVLQMDPDKALSQIGAALGGVFRPPGVQLRGLEGEQAPGHPPAADQQVYTYSEERLLAALDKMRRHFDTDDEFMTALESLADQFDQNPNLFKSYLA